MGVGPQAVPVPVGVVLERPELVPLVVGDVAPCQPSADHLGVDQLASDRHTGDHAPVAVLVDLLDRHGLVGDQIGEGFPGDGAESLLSLRGVDPVEPHLHLTVLGVQPGEGVTIGDADHAQVAGCGAPGEGEEQGNGEEGGAWHQFRFWPPSLAAATPETKPSTNSSVSSSSSLAFWAYFLPRRCASLSVRRIFA